MQLPIRTVSTLLCLCTLLLGTASARAAILNGSFELGAFSPDGNGAMSLSAGNNTSMTGWTVINAELAWINTTNNFGLLPADGDFFLDLTGYHDAPAYAGVEQSIATTIGNQYLLTFDLGTAVIGTTTSIRVTAGSSSDTLSATATIAGGAWHARN